MLRGVQSTLIDVKPFFAKQISCYAPRSWMRGWLLELNNREGCQAARITALLHQKSWGADRKLCPTVAEIKSKLRIVRSVPRRV